MMIHQKRFQIKYILGKVTNSILHPNYDNGYRQIVTVKQCEPNTFLRMAIFFMGQERYVI